MVLVRLLSADTRSGEENNGVGFLLKLSVPVGTRK